MSQVCTKCITSIRPTRSSVTLTASPLAATLLTAGEFRRGRSRFPASSCFPPGQACHNFDQLAVACQDNWTSAVDLLKQGFLASFLGGIGRADLAMAAKEAAGFPDTDRGLDQAPGEIADAGPGRTQRAKQDQGASLGVVPFGADRNFELHLSNLGMRCCMARSAPIANG